MANNVQPMALRAVPFDPPDFKEALRNVTINVVDDENILRQEKAYLIENSNNPSQCYQRWPNRATLPLNGRGELVYCRVLLRDRTSPDQVVFRKSDMTVVIKKLRRWIIDPALERERQGGPVVNENPYNEVAVMQQYENFQHVMPCYQALKDERYLYIVMLYMRDGDLHSHIDWRLGGGYHPRDQIPALVTILVKNLQFLHERHLTHRDLKPENCMIHPPWIVFIDFAMTLQSAVMEGIPQDIEPHGPAGSESYISPEVFHNRAFNPKADIWALGCIVWSLLTGLRLYSIPHDTDRCYEFFITGGGLWNEDLCERTLEEFLAQNAQNDLRMRIQAVQVLSREERKFLAWLLQPDPLNRPSLQQILQHPFLQ